MKRYLIIGAGVRGYCFAEAIQKRHPEHATLAGVFDHNLSRASAFVDLLTAPVPVGSDFSRLVADTRPDAVIITTPDNTHDDMVELAFRHGLDAITEKPMAISWPKVQRILELERQYGRRVLVTFNMRYATYSVRLKQVLAEHDIGDIRSVHVEWCLDKVHGPEYFRRWHRYLDRSGGLLVHKATHHFDLVNWYLNDEPARVTAFGSLQHLGAANPFHGKSCRTCPHTAKCPYPMDLSTWDAPSRHKIESLYFHAEHEDGYLRDACVFDPSIDIYDTMSVAVQYRRGAQLNYSLIAYAPHEGYRMTFTGTTGRIEAEELFGGLMLQGKNTVNRIRLIRGTNRQDTDIQDIDFAVDRGDHGGGDSSLYRHLFVPGAPDPLGQAADSRAGALSCLVGIFANQSIRQSRTMTIPALTDAPPAEAQAVPPASMTH